MGKTREKKTRRPKSADPARSNGATPSHDENRPIDSHHADGRTLRKQAPRSSQAEWSPPSDRRDPIELIVESSEDRVPHLVPIRYGRMLQSPFAFFRGGAAIMAADLAHTPVTGLRVQACGDCHLLNFGIFATPERRLIFDINDFDESLPAPWEWDLKRLTTSFVIAGEHNGFRAAQSREASLACARSYREQMARFSHMRAIDVWYERVDVNDLLARAPKKEFRRQDRDEIRRASRGIAEHADPKLWDDSEGQAKIHDRPPLIYHPEHEEAREFMDQLSQAFHAYRDSLPDERRVLLDRYQLIDYAAKVVGVGSVGTRCGILLLMAGPEDALFLQVKEACQSVLEPYAGKSAYPNHGERVVIGQRLMQAASDLFLGWTHGHAGRSFYVRQLRDVKVKPLVEVYDPPTMASYAESCGWALARAHARSGDPARISGYLGSSDRFDRAVTDFAEAYAGQNQSDHAQLARAVAEGRLQVEMER